MSSTPALTDTLYWHCIESIDYTGLEEPYRHSIRNYVERGVSPGSALRAALEGNIKALLLFRDATVLERLVLWMHNSLPAPLWGNRKRVRAWMRMAQRLAGPTRPRCMSVACRSEFSAVGL